MHQNLAKFIRRKEAKELRKRTQVIQHQAETAEATAVPGKRMIFVQIIKSVPNPPK